MDSPNPTDSVPGEEADTPESSFNSGSLLDRIKSKIPDTSQLTKIVLIPVGVVATVLLLGVGGTYIIAANVLESPAGTQTVNEVSQADLGGSSESAESLVTPSPKVAAAPTVNPSQAGGESTPTPTPDLASDWTPYTFAALSLQFSYPPGWFVNVPSTSGAPYLYVQNFSGNIPPGYSPGQFSILISRLEQIGITTISALTTQLALNAASNVNLNGVNMGQVNVITSTPTVINGYQALQRSVTYSSSPSAQMTETYILDGVSNVIELVPFLDTTYGMSYYNTLLSTIQFSN